MWILELCLTMLYFKWFPFATIMLTYDADPGEIYVFLLSVDHVIGIMFHGHLEVAFFS